MRLSHIQVAGHFEEEKKRATDYRALLQKLPRKIRHPMGLHAV